MHIEFEIKDGSGLLWLAPRDLGGLPPAEFAARMSAGDTTRILVESGLVAPVALFEDAGFVVRLVQDELTEQEAAEWVAAATGWLNLETGGVLVSGVLSPSYFAADFPQFGEIAQQRSLEQGGWLPIEAGRYRVEIYSYAPTDLSGFWYCLSEPELYGMPEGMASEDPHEWLVRTRPGERVPWFDGSPGVARGYVGFVVRLSPLTDTVPPLALTESGHLDWEYRRPERFPLGLRCGERVHG